MNVINRLVEKTKEFKKISEHIASKYDVQSMEKPDDELILLTQKNAKVTKELFDIVNEIEVIEGKDQSDL